jgi:hypothetical protein
MRLFGRLFGYMRPAPACEIHTNDEVLVREEDISWWISLSRADCKALEQEDNELRLTALKKFMEEDGMEEEAATRRVRRLFPIYYQTLEQRDEEHVPVTEADARLPYVLKDRVNQAVMNGTIDLVAADHASSMNALIRGLINSGKM